METLELVLDETLLNDEAKCCKCDEGASALARLRCCRDTKLIGSTCLGRAREVIAAVAGRAGQCAHCGAVVTFTTYDAIVEVIPI